jgi:hypothetical protein
VPVTTDSTEKLYAVCLPSMARPTVQTSLDIQPFPDPPDTGIAHPAHTAAKLSDRISFPSWMGFRYPAGMRGKFATADRWKKISDVT